MPEKIPISREAAIILVHHNVVNCVHSGLLPPFLTTKALDPAELLIEELNKDLKSIFGQAQREFIKQLSRSGVLPSSMERKRLLDKILKPALDDMANEVADAGVRAAALGRADVLGQMRAAGLTFDAEFFNEAAREALRTGIFEASQGTMDRIVGDVVGNLVESFDAGLGTANIARNLEEVFEDMNRWQLERIARTEVNGAQNEGSHATMVEAGIEFKIWLTAQDDRVRGNKETDRANHIIMHGEVRRTDEPYSNGLMYPGDTSTGILEEFINCRCKDKCYFPAPEEIITITPYYPYGIAA